MKIPIFLFPIFPHLYSFNSLKNTLELEMKCFSFYNFKAILDTLDTILTIFTILKLV